MKILAIMGSLRKGNTYGVVKRVEDALRAHGDVAVEEIFLHEADLERCRGCFLCLPRGEELCPLKDDRAAIEKKILSSDGLILASPNYANNVTWLMTNFIDRFAFIGHRPRFFDRSLLLVATSSFIGANQVLDKLAYFAAGGFKSVTRLAVNTPAVPLSEKRLEKAQRAIDRAASRFYESMARPGRPTPGFGNIIHFRVFQSLYKYGGDVAASAFPADVKYWSEKGWLDRRDYFTGQRLGPVKKAFSRAAGRLFRTLGVRMITG